MKQLLVPFVLAFAIQVAAMAGMTTSGIHVEQTQKAKAPKARQGVKATNKPPAFPTEMKIDHKTTMEYDEAGRVFGGTTTIEVLTPAVDPDGDTITYAWEGEEVNHVYRENSPNSWQQWQSTKIAERIKGEGTKATWKRIVVMGELASAFLTLKASDGKGGEAVYKFCVGSRVRC